jgi:hypothetical protein
MATSNTIDLRPWEVLHIFVSEDKTHQLRM